MDTPDWLLTSRERGNPATHLDERHAGKAARPAGSLVQPLVHAAAAQLIDDSAEQVMLQVVAMLTAAAPATSTTCGHVTAPTPDSTLR
jgi:hypothetical protein